MKEVAAHGIENSRDAHKYPIIPEPEFATAIGADLFVSHWKLRDFLHALLLSMLAYEARGASLGAVLFVVYPTCRVFRPLGTHWAACFLDPYLPILAT